MAPVIVEQPVPPPLTKETEAEPVVKKFLNEDDDDDDDDNDHHQGHYGPRGGGWGRGIVADVRRTVGTHWKQEMLNFNQKSLAVSFFLFFACIAPAITFGAIYAKATHNWIGAVEMIAATAWVGLVYGLIGGQPMMINGGTGPVLAFTEILYKMSQSMDVPFLTLNAWIGLWVAAYMVVAAVIDLNRFIVYATRFTDEIFALLIATIFIINAIGSPFAEVGIVYYFRKSHPSHEEHADDPEYSYMAAALLSVLVCIGTVQMAFFLRKAKFSSFGPHQLVRNIVTDFAVVLSIVFMTFVSNVVFSNIPTESLNVPETFAPTFACCTDECIDNWPDDCPTVQEPARRRPWMVDLWDLEGKGWVPLMAAGPAILAFILVFLDNGITWHLINHPSHKLTHGEAFNYDTLLIGFTIAVNSILGMPWLVAATVRSLNHVHAMAEKSADGRILSVQETRLTHLGIHLLCLVAIFTLNVLKLIPMAVLYGVFLFMGLVSLGTNQFWGRLMMFFIQPSKYPVEPYTMHVQPRRMHYFTLFQLGLFALLYAVKAVKAIAIAFPLVIACCIPVRLYLLPKFFTAQELIMIDSDDAAIQKWLRQEEKLLMQQQQQEEEKLLRGEENDKDEDAAKKDLVDSAGTTPPPEEEEDDDDDDEDVDEEHVAPLPETTDAERRRRRHRHRAERKKSLSCPAPAMLHMAFFEDPSTETAMAPTRARGVMIVDDSAHSLDDSDLLLPSQQQQLRLRMHAATDVVVVGGTAAAPRRRRRTKALSCSTHQLFAEAERHVASNYFFG